MRNTYVIVKCEALSDQFECDADRIPLLVLVNVQPEALEKFKKYGYDIYVATTGGTLKKIQKYDDYDQYDHYDLF